MLADSGIKPPAVFFWAFLQNDHEASICLCIFSRTPFWIYVFFVTYFLYWILFRCDDHLKFRKKACDVKPGQSLEDSAFTHKELISCYQYVIIVDNEMCIFAAFVHICTLLSLEMYFLRIFFIKCVHVNLIVRIIQDSDLYTGYNRMFFIFE